MPRPCHRLRYQAAMNDGESYQLSPLALLPDGTRCPTDRTRPGLGTASSSRPSLQSTCRSYEDQSPLLLRSSPRISPNRAPPSQMAIDMEIQPAASVQPYLFSEESTRTTKQLRQSISCWLPEIISGLVSLACVTGEPSDQEGAQGRHTILR